MLLRNRPGLLAAAGLLLLYLALGQNAMHGLDAYHYLRFVQEGHLRNDLNLFYQPVAWAWVQLFGRFGLPTYEAMRALSAVGAALGVFAAWRAGLAFGLDRPRALLLAIGCGVVPAVLQAATVVEIDALLFACSALAWIPFARLLRTDRWPLAIATGAGTALAAGFHAAGHLLALVLCGLQVAWQWPERPLHRTAPRALLLASVHGGLTFGLGRLLGAAGQASMASNTAALSLPWDFVPQVLWHEWLLPYAPFCLLPFAALLRRDLRSAVVAFALCLLGYLMVTALVLGLLRPTGPALPHDAVREFGSFLLGSTVPAVLLAVLALPVRIGQVAVAVAAVAGITQVRLRDWPADPSGYDTGFRAVVADRPYQLLVDDAREWAWLARRASLRPPLLVRGYLEVEVPALVAQQGGGIAPEHYAAQFAVWAHSKDMPLLLSERALQRISASPVPALREFAREQLATSCVLEPVQAAGFTGYWLRPR